MPLTHTFAPLEFNPRDNIDELSNSIFRYLIEPFEISAEMNSFLPESTHAYLKHDDTPLNKICQTLAGIISGNRKYIAVMRNETEYDTISKLYELDNINTIEMVNKIHNLLREKSGNIDYDRVVRRCAISIIDYFSHSKNLLGKIALENLIPAVTSVTHPVMESRILPKTSGDQMGVSVIIKYLDTENDKEKDLRFYVKTQQNFKLTSTSTSGRRSSVSGAEEKIDFSELLIYKILEKLKIGPKCFFTVHPFARGAILISTQAVDFSKKHPPENKKFFEASKLAEKPESLGDHDITDLNMIDLISRVLNITDLNSTNFGRVSVEDDQGTKHKWKIIDFRILDPRMTRSIYTDFMEAKDGNDSFVKSSGFVERFVRPEKSKKDEIASSLLKRLEEGKDFKKETSFNAAVTSSMDEIYSLLDQSSTKSYLGLDSEKIAEIKEKLKLYETIIRGNYKYFKDALLESQKTR